MGGEFVATGRVLVEQQQRLAGRRLQRAAEHMHFRCRQLLDPCTRSGSMTETRDSWHTFSSPARAKLHTHARLLASHTASARTPAQMGRPGLLLALLLLLPAVAPKRASATIIDTTAIPPAAGVVTLLLLLSHQLLLAASFLSGWALSSRRRASRVRRRGEGEGQDQGRRPEPDRGRRR